MRTVDEANAVSKAFTEDHPNYIHPELIEQARRAGIHCVDDYKTIRAISMLVSRGGENLTDRINPLYDYCGLYPFVMQAFDIMPEGIEPGPAVKGLHTELNQLYEDRRKSKDEVTKIMSKIKS